LITSPWFGNAQLPICFHLCIAFFQYDDERVKGGYSCQSQCLLSGFIGFPALLADFQKGFKRKGVEQYAFLVSEKTPGRIFQIVEIKNNRSLTNPRIPGQG
jgi:hypothetical protein